MFNKIASKINLFMGRTEILKYYLSKSQIALDNKFRSSSKGEIELKILETDK